MPASSHKPPLQVWTSGKTKDGKTFNPLKGDEPSPIEVLLDVTAGPCIMDVPFAPENLTVPIQPDFIVDPDHLRIRVEAPTSDQHTSQGYDASLPWTVVWVPYSKHHGPGLVSFGGCLQGGETTTDYNYGVVFVPDDAPVTPRIVEVDSPHDYHMSTMQAGATIFTDRPYLTDGCTVGLDGHPFLQTPNDDRFNAQPHVVTVSLDQPSSVFVFFQNLEGERPLWCRGDDWLIGDYRTYVWHRTPLWSHREAIEGPATGTPPLPRNYLKVRDIKCEPIPTTLWKQLQGLPYPAVWVLFLERGGPAIYHWTCGLYWSPQVDGDPCGTYIQFREWWGGTHSYIPPYLEVEPLDKGKPAPLPCPTNPVYLFPHHDLSACWFDCDERREYIGVNWTIVTPAHADREPDGSYLPEFCSVSNITCVPDDRYAGEWRFWVTYYRHGQYFELCYHRPSLGRALGLVGLYRLHDPDEQYLWATPGVFVFDAFTAWPEPPLPVAIRVAKEIAILIAFEILGCLSIKLLNKMSAYLLTQTTYDLSKLRRAALDAKIIAQQAARPRHPFSTIFLKAGSREADWSAANFAWQVIRMKSRLPPLP